MKKIFLNIGLLLLAAAIAAMFMAPWDGIVENRLKAYLHSRGVTDVTFTVDQVSFHEATLSNISVGAESPLLLQSVKVQYDLSEMMNGTLRALTIDGLDIQIAQVDGAWIVTGLNSFHREDKPDTPPPTLSDIVDRLPFSVIRITDSFIRIGGTSRIQATLPFTATFTKTPDTTLSMTISPSTVGAGAAEYDLGTIKAELTPDANRAWHGTWEIDSIDTKGGLPVPVMAGGGTLSYDNDTLGATGTLNSKDKTHTASFKAVYDIPGRGARALTITNLSLPFKEGRVSSRNIVVPLGERKDITAPLTVKNVSMDALLGTLTGERVNATGSVSGTVPVILKKDGTFSLGKGTLTADSAGIIQMNADAIPGNNEQVGLLRDILENLQYTLLTAAVETSGGQGIVVRLSLEGHNPDVYGGHPVKLNVNLTGDVLDFIQQNAMLITKPETLLKRELQ